jgi:hypothetical protein
MTSSQQNEARFQFEKFRDGKGFADTFLAIHPSGTPTDVVLQTLKNAGAMCFEMTENDIAAPSSLRGLPSDVQQQLKEMKAREPYKVDCVYNQSMGYGVVRKWHIKVMLDANGIYVRPTARNFVVGL